MKYILKEQKFMDLDKKYFNIIIHKKFKISSFIIIRYLTIVDIKISNYFVNNSSCYSLIEILICVDCAMDATQIFIEILFLSIFKLKSSFQKKKKQKAKILV